jgi:hypothetical protein
MSDQISRSAWVPVEQVLGALIQADSGLRDELADAVGGRVDELWSGRLAVFYAAAARGRA